MKPFMIVENDAMKLALTGLVHHEEIIDEVLVFFDFSVGYLRPLQLLGHVKLSTKVIHFGLNAINGIAVHGKPTNDREPVGGDTGLVAEEGVILMASNWHDATNASDETPAKPDRHPRPPESQV